jgi:iron complex transport system permease protein
MKSLSNRRKLALLCGAAFLTCLAAPFIGMEPITPAGLRSNPLTRDIFLSLRLPRTLTAFLAGSALALAGMTFQALFRNPLATPYTLGIASGASCGAAAAVLFGGAALGGGIGGAAVGAFIGALCAMAVVYALFSAVGARGPVTMLLAGVAVSYTFSSLLLFVQYLSDIRHSFQIVRWLMGGVAVHGYDHLWLIGASVAGGGAIIGLHVHHLDHLLTGEELAQSRGVNTAWLKGVLFIGVSLMVAGVVAICGPIGFVGMMSPHVCRMLFGPRHATLGPATMLFGGAFLVICDTAARTILAPVEAPAGVITALMGGPFFIWLLYRNHRAGRR